MPASPAMISWTATGGGPVQVKGKGELVTWFLLGRNDGSGPTA
jgi:hypothetical protein